MIKHHWTAKAPYAVNRDEKDSFEAYQVNKENNEHS